MNARAFARSIAKRQKVRAKPRRIEDGIQRQIVAAIRRAYPHMIIFAVPNGGRRGVVEAAIMKGTGTLAGVADLVICWPGHVGFLEVKSPAGRLSAAQKDFAARCAALDLRYAVVRSPGDVLDRLKEWGAV